MKAFTGHRGFMSVLCSVFKAGYTQPRHATAAHVCFAFLGVICERRFMCVFNNRSGAGAWIARCMVLVCCVCLFLSSFDGFRLIKISTVSASV